MCRFGELENSQRHHDRIGEGQSSLELDARDLRSR
jgi:hypothetical protein